ncbi:MAG: hypothetical protein HY047_06130 [Acidobacteria bacterium]|nr:hypothetical protein [Acidobacteriota bacterium]
MHRRRILWRLTLLLGLSAGAASCGRLAAEQTTDAFTVTLATSSQPVQVGEETVTIKIAPKKAEPSGDTQVLLHYYPFVYRVKDSLASPDEAARIVTAARDSNSYRATLKLDKPGPWKIAARIRQPGKPDTIVYFTVTAHERSAAAGT